ncbi:hypothetical protein YSY43_40860 [Paenibacillus sp. YSY-4.3]
MKITDWAIIFVLIASPLLWVLHLHTGDLKEAHRLQLRYTSALRTAVQDAAHALNLNERQHFEAGYGSAKYMRTDKEEALSAFIETLSINLGIEDDPYAQSAMMAYIPAIAVIEYDGYSIYALHESIEASTGLPEISHRWRAKRPYVYMDQTGNSIAFTLDDAVTAYESRSGEWQRGRQSELKLTTAIPLLQDTETFEQVRRATIVRAIEVDLAGYMNRHNEYAARIGVNYLFTLPTLSQEEWTNTLNDVGVIVFVQGIPVGDRYYNNYAFGGGRLMQSKLLVGGIDETTGLHYYFREGCPSIYRAEQAFTNRRAAAAKGYYEDDCR